MLDYLYSSLILLRSVPLTTVPWRVAWHSRARSKMMKIISLNCIRLCGVTQRILLSRESQFRTAEYCSERLVIYQLLNFSLGLCGVKCSVAISRTESQRHAEFGRAWSDP